MRTAVMEQVVLVDDSGATIGTALKSEVHTQFTPLHLAFSCYLINANDELLLTRRALSKATWPGVWTNSFCGHPAPDESLEDAVVRRAHQELRVDVHEISMALEDFRYRAVDASGIVENELCPVFTARSSSVIDADPEEVTEWQWVDAARLKAAVQATPFIFSPWLVEQLPRLFARGVLPVGDE